MLISLLFNMFFFWRFHLKKFHHLIHAIFNYTYRISERSTPHYYFLFSVLAHALAVTAHIGIQIIFFAAAPTIYGPIFIRPIRNELHIVGCAKISPICITFMEYACIMYDICNLRKSTHVYNLQNNKKPTMYIFSLFHLNRSKLSRMHRCTFLPS